MLQYKNDIIREVDSNPNLDKIVIFDIVLPSPIKLDENTFVSGSYALYQLMLHLKLNIKFTSNSDINVYHVNGVEEKKTSKDCIEHSYVIHDIQHVLLNIDLPCCRIAYNDRRVYVSVQCLYSIFTGRYYIKAFKNVMSKETQRFINRMEFYTKMGFQPILYKMNKL